MEEVERLEIELGRKTTVDQLLNQIEGATLVREPTPLFPDDGKVLLAYIAALRVEVERYREALGQIANRSDDELRLARTLHYDLVGIARAALAAPAPRTADHVANELRDHVFDAYRAAGAPHGDPVSEADLVRWMDDAAPAPAPREEAPGYTGITQRLDAPKKVTVVLHGLHYYPDGLEIEVDERFTLARDDAAAGA